MKTYTPIDIHELIPSITTRQIIDITQKGIVVPAEPSTKKGQANKYSQKNIFQLMVAVAIRGAFLSPIAKQIVAEATKSKKQFLRFKRASQKRNKFYEFTNDFDVNEVMAFSKADGLAHDYVKLGDLWHIVKEKF